MKTKKELEMILSGLKPVQDPIPSLEQYTIPGGLAAEILNLAYLRGDIKGKRVADFGCGTGRLSIGALLVGAKEVVGVDVDNNVLETAMKNLDVIIRSELSVKGSIKFLRCDIKNYSDKFDTVIQNPPFGIQSKHADRLFLEKALKCGKKVYSLHKNGYQKTQEFVVKFVEDRNGKVKQIIPYKFLIPHMFKFHKKPRKELSVDLYMIESAKLF